MTAIVRILLGALYAYSGFLKLTHPVENFQAVIQSYQIIQGAPTLLLAHVLPWVELLAGIFFLAGLWLRLSLYSILAMNLMFIGVLAQAILRKLPINDCGCFGGALNFKPWQTLLMDVVITAVLIFMLRCFDKTRKWSLDQYFDRG